ncbi:MAG: Sir2 family NAD-dependent protein deacetylase [Pseudomonadota bacterium]
MDTNLMSFLKELARGQGRLTVLTGAGISAESGIPTFRGPEGYWTVGAKEYQPQEMATYRMFSKDPWEVWRWYLYRLGICAQAAPNLGHAAIVAMEQLFSNRFTLITQNVDGLHLRAGSSPERTYQIHGNIFFRRCDKPCTNEIFPIPSGICGKQRHEIMTEQEKKALRCPLCGGLTRPHVLWFDESYDETHFRFESSLAAAAKTDLLLVVGTSGATNLPNQVAWQVHHRGGMIVDINIEHNPFTDLALKSGRGYFINESSGAALPAMIDIFREGK